MSIRNSESLNCTRCGLEKFETKPLLCPTCQRAQEIIRGAWKKFPPLLAALVALFATGCAGNVFYVDSRFTSEEEKAIEGSQAKWEAVGADHLDLVFGQKTTGFTDTRNEIVRAREREACALTPHFADPHTQGVRVHNRTGLGDSNSVVVLNIDRIDPEQFPRVVLHEIGHIHVGSPHAPERGAVMFHEADSDEITATDRHLLMLARQP